LVIVPQGLKPMLIESVDGTIKIESFQNVDLFPGQERFFPASCSASAMLLDESNGLSVHGRRDLLS
jgi:hypothetical protein